MTNPAHLIRRYPMLSFAALACLLGWSSYIASALGLGENNPLGPLVATLAVLGCQGRPSLGGWWRGVRSWRAAPGWYALAILTPALVHAVNVLINHSLGAPLPTPGQLSHWPEIPVGNVALLPKQLGLSPDISQGAECHLDPIGERSGQDGAGIERHELEDA